MSAARESEAPPWGLSDLGRLGSGSLLALGALVVSYWGTAEHARVGDQVGWLVAGLAAVGWLSLRCAVFLAAGYRALAMQRAALDDGLSLLQPERAAAAPDSGSDQLVALPGLTYYHRSDCAFIAGKSAGAVDPLLLTSDGPRPCPACRP
jgi:hypothetical protein